LDAARREEQVADAEVRIEPAEEGDAATLSEIAVRAFHTDTDYGHPDGRGGPPGYDSPAAQARFMRHCNYYKILFSGRIVGALLVAPRGPRHCECVGVWVDSDYHRQGIARRAFELVFAAYARVTRWTVETPVWNTRTAAFYPALGFRKVGEKGDSAVYELRLPGRP
jgi:ribosomal protein S18 acetylase RimI-like enzyme